MISRSRWRGILFFAVAAMAQAAETLLALEPAPSLPNFPCREVCGRLKTARKRFMLPVKAGTRECVRESQQCSRKIIEFRDSRRFTGESKIIYQARRR